MTPPRLLLCTVQHGQLRPGAHRQLERALRERYARDLGRRVVVVWCELPRGRAFTRGEPSSMAWLLGDADDDLDPEVRADLLRGITEDWARVAQVAPEQLMVTLCDRSVLRRYLALSRTRVHPAHRPALLLRTTARAASAVLTRRRLAISLDY